MRPHRRNVSHKRLCQVDEDGGVLGRDSNASPKHLAPVEMFLYFPLLEAKILRRLGGTDDEKQFLLWSRRTINLFYL